MISVIVAFVGWVILFPALFLSGSIVGPMLKEENIMMRGILYFAFGMGMLAYCIVLIGSFGLLKPLPVLLLLMGIFLFRFSHWREFVAWGKAIAQFVFVPEKGIYKFFQISFLVSLLITFGACFLPEIGNDSLCYQLNLPKIFVRTGFTHTLEYDFNSYMSLLMNHLYAVGLLFKSVAIAKLFHWLTGMILVLAFVVVLDRATNEKSLSLFFGLMLWLTPTLINQVSATYVDVAFAFFLFLAAYLFLSGRKDKTVSTFLLSGLLLGFAVSVKYLALIACLPLGILLVKEFIVQPKRSATLICAMMFAVGLFLGCGFWIIRNWWITGNPIFPYYGQLFGVETFHFSHGSIGKAKSLLSYLLMPVSITFEPKYYDFHHWIGPFYLLLLPFVGVALIRDRKSWFYIFFSTAYATAWYFVGQNVRYLLPILPLYLVAGVSGVRICNNLYRHQWASSLSRISACALVFFLLALVFYHYRHAMLVLSGKWTSQQYLENLERSSSIAKWINDNLPKNAKIFNAEEIHQFYFDRESIRAEWFERVTRYSALENPKEFVQLLKKEGFTHILKAGPIGPDGKVQRQKRFDIIDRALGSEDFTELLIRQSSSNIRDIHYEYVVYKLR